MPKSILNAQARKVIKIARSRAIENPGEAIKIINRYLLSRPKDPISVLILKGNILDSAGDFELAARTYRQVLHSNSTNVPALTDLGDFYANIKHDLVKALHYYRQAVEASTAGHYWVDAEDEFVDACSEMASTLVNLKREKIAMKCLLDGLQRYPLNGILFDAFRKARQSYEKRLRLPRPPVR